MTPRFDDGMDGADRRTAELLRGALQREADAVTPSPDGLARILAASCGPQAARGPSTVELPAVSRPAAPPRLVPAAGSDHAPDGRPEGAADGAPGPARGFGARVRRLVPRPRRADGPADGGAGHPPGARPSRWTPALATAAAVVVLAGGLGAATRVGVVHAPSLTSVGWAARQGRPASTLTAVVTPPPLPVYLVSRQQGRWALVREFATTTLTGPAERLEAALRLAVAGVATDRDLTSAWAQQRLTGEVHAELTGGGVIVRLSDGLVAGRAASTERALLARLAVQQLVWTATAVAGPGHDGPVRLEGPAGGTVLFDEVRLDAPFTRDVGDRDPRAPVWISSVSDGQRVRQGAALVSGDAVTTDTGTVQWTLTGPDGATAATGSQRLVRQDGSLPLAGERSLFTLHLTLPEPGSYQLTVTQTWPWASAGQVWTETKTLEAA